MLKHEDTLLASASDIVNYLGCVHRTTLDLIDLETPLEKAPDDEEMQLVQEKGRVHEAGFLEGLRKPGGLVEVAQEMSLEEKLERTREAMRAGARVIYQAALHEWRLGSSYRCELIVRAPNGDLLPASSARRQAGAARP